MSQPTIRLARRGDAPALARLRYRFRAGHEPPVEPEADFLARCTAWMEPRLAAGGSWRCWIAEEAGRMVGTIWLQRIEKLPNPVGEAESHGYISSLYVEPSARGRGLGSRLLEACLAVCRADAMDAVLLWPTPRSRPLYERHGFAVSDDLLQRRLAAMPGHAARPAPEGDMNDDRVVRLLEEIRDLQRQHAERYGEALKNQEDSIRLQQAGLRRMRIVLAFATVAVILVIAVVVILVLRVLTGLA